MRYRETVGTLVRRSFAVSALATAATALGLVFAFSASAAGNHHRLGVFSHPMHHRGHASAQKPPAGAVLAELFGGAEVYVSEGGGLLCLRVIDTASEGSACGNAGEVQREGMLTVHVDSSGRVRVGVLAPNGVSSVTLTDHDGASHRVAVTNNVAESYDSDVASVRYKLANGSTHSESIPAEVVKPRPPR